MNPTPSDSSKVLKALELARDYVEEASCKGYDGTMGDSIRAEAKRRLAIIDEALTGVAPSVPAEVGEAVALLQEALDGEPNWSARVGAFLRKVKAAQPKAQAPAVASEAVQAQAGGVREALQRVVFEGLDDQDRLIPSGALRDALIEAHGLLYGPQAPAPAGATIADVMRCRYPVCKSIHPSGWGWDTSRLNEVLGTIQRQEPSE